MKQKKIVYIGSFLLPIIIMVIVYSRVSIYPFGDKAILTRDLSQQYVEFFAAFKDAILKDRSLLYSFSKTLGGNMIGLFSYYLASPLNLIFLFFEKEDFAMVVFYLTLIKIGLSGFTFSIFLSKSFKRSDYSVIFFSLAYSLMTYNIVYQQNIIWLEGVILLPLMLLGIENLIKKNKSLLYFLVLTISILTNWYIGYMLCLFSFLYFIYTMIITRKDETKNKIKIFLRYIQVSILGVLSSSVILIPTICAMRNDKGHFHKDFLRFYQLLTPEKFMSKYIIGSYNIVELAFGGPNIYCSFVVMILFFIYFFNKKVTIGEKLAAALIFIIFISSFFINTINIVWHGFKPPNWFPYRYSFLFSAFIILIAYKSYLYICHIKSIIILFISSLFLIGIYIVTRENYEYLPRKGVLLSFFFVALIAILLVLIREFKRFKVVSSIFLMGVIALELSANALGILSAINYDAESSLKNYVRNVEPVVKKIKNMDQGFYRMEETFRHSPNDALLLDYNGITHFSSTGDSSNRIFGGKVGYTDNSGYSVYNNQIIGIDSLLGIKYLISKDDESSTLKIIDTNNKINAYENPYALSIGYKVDEEVKTLELNDENPFINQNKLYQGITGDDENYIYYPMEEPEITYRNIEKEENNYKKINEKSDGIVEYTFTAKDDNPMYAYLESEEIQGIGADMYINGQHKGIALNIDMNNIIYLGSYKKGEKVKLKLRLLGENLNIKGGYYYSLDMDNFEKSINILKKNQMDFKKKNDANLTAKVTVTENSIYLTTIPYDDGWKVKIDGKEVEKEKLLNNFIGIKIEEGNHHIEFKYTPKGLNLGIMVSILSMMTYGIYFFREKRRL